MFLSVIIPVYRDFERLKKCVHSISTQLEENPDNTPIEVIVVNNDSGAELPSLPDSELQIKVINCEKQGSYAARNKGAKLASGKYIAFTDSDCTVGKDWLSNIKRSIEENPGADLISGSVILYPEFHDQPNSFEAYDMILGIDQSAYAQKKNPSQLIF